MTIVLDDSPPRGPATKRALIMQALEDIGITEDFDPTPEELQSALRRMDRMAAEWEGIGVSVGYDMAGGLNDLAGIPVSAENCFAVNLGVRIARSFGKAVTADAKVEAGQALNAMMVAHITVPEVPYPASLPLGTGNRQGVMEQQYFPDSTTEG